MARPRSAAFAFSIGQPDWAGEVLPVTITKDQVKYSPVIDTDKPISRQYERSYLGYYGYPYYWGGTGLWGERDRPGAMLTGMGSSGFRGYLRAPSAGPNADSNPRTAMSASANAPSVMDIDASSRTRGAPLGATVQTTLRRKPRIFLLVANASYQFSNRPGNARHSQLESIGDIAALRCCSRCYRVQTLR